MEPDIVDNNTLAATSEPTAPRRSERGVKLKRAYSPELTSKPKALKSSKNKFLRQQKHVSIFGNNDCIAADKLLLCDKCNIPLIFSQAIKLKKKLKFVSADGDNIETSKNKAAILCSSCTSKLTKQRKRIKQSIPSDEEKEIYKKEAQAFASSLVNTLRDQDAERLFCPEFKLHPCACIQKFILAEGNIEESHKRAHHLLQLLKEAKRLSQLKYYNIQEIQNISSKGHRRVIGVGNGHKRSLQFEKFVLQQRQYLKRELHLCERACQKVLMYSNNFLHKKLKTEPEKVRRVQRSKGKAVLGLLRPIEELHTRYCCKNNCVLMAVTHGMLLQHWRDRASSGQAEARRVMAEMLTPGGLTVNCFKFISWVTGCSISTISKVKEQMHITGGDREPPEHGLKRYWQEHLKEFPSIRHQFLDQENYDSSPEASVRSDPMMSPESTEAVCTLSASLGAEVIVGDTSTFADNQRIDIGLKSHNAHLQRSEEEKQHHIADLQATEISNNETGAQVMGTELVLSQGLETEQTKFINSSIMLPVVTQSLPSTSLSDVTTTSLLSQQVVLEGLNGEQLGAQLLSTSLGNVIFIQPSADAHAAANISNSDLLSSVNTQATGLFSANSQLNGNFITTLSLSPVAGEKGIKNTSNILYSVTPQKNVSHLGQDIMPVTLNNINLSLQDKPVSQTLRPCL